MHNPSHETVHLTDGESVPQPPNQLAQGYIVTNIPDPRHRNTRLRRIPVSNGQRMRPLTPPPSIELSYTPSVSPAIAASTLEAGVWPPGTQILLTLAHFCPCNIQGHPYQQYTRCEYLPGKLCTVYVGPVPFSHKPPLPPKNRRKYRLTPLSLSRAVPAPKRTHPLHANPSSRTELVNGVVLGGVGLGMIRRVIGRGWIRRGNMGGIMRISRGGGYDG